MHRKFQAIQQNHQNSILFNETILLKGQSHEKVGEMSVWGISLGPN
jgi:hypothetical protein